MHTIHLLTGSNIGNSATNLEAANGYIQMQIGTIEKTSPVYKTEPWGNKDQQHFFNQVLEVQTPLSSHQLMQTILEIEHTMGRNRLIKWEPRIIDIDILFFDDLIIDEEELKIPHPLLHERRFTLVPLNEISPQLFHPVFKKTISQLLSSCPDAGAVEKL